MIFNMHLLMDASRFLIRRFYPNKTVFTVLINIKKLIRLLKNFLEEDSKPVKWSLPIQEEPVANSKAHAIANKSQSSKPLCCCIFKL